MDYDEAGPADVRIMTRKYLVTIMQQQNLSNVTEKLKYLENFLLKLDNYSDEHIREIRRNFSRFKSEFNRRWAKSLRIEDNFVMKNKEWLEGSFTIPKVTKRSGRPSKPFLESSDRSKRRKTEELRKSADLHVLTHAAQSKLRESGKRDASLVLKDLTKSPKRATRYKRAFSHASKANITTTQLSPLQALSIFVEAGLSRKQYEIIRRAHPKLYPCYSILQKEKNKCYPDKKHYRVTESYAETNLQGLMDHTVTRQLTHLKDVLPQLKEEEKDSLVLICKWGCDGAQQVQYKQKFINDSDSDANLFQSSFVPLQLMCSKNNKVVWQNPTPSSPRYCRPIRMRFIKETTDITNEEIGYVRTSINMLQDTKVTSADKIYSVKHRMILTMVDGKVCNAATNTTSTMRCYICGLTSKDFNNLKIRKEVNTEALTFGLSILHARIRFFESVLHLSYKLPVKKWQLRTKSEKDIVQKNKLEIQERFRVKMGLIVDVPKPGFGNTNDGNTSRRFFADHELAAEITGIDVNLVYRLKVILETLSSGHRIHTDLFSAYAKETAELYVQLYPWHPMTPTLHKILIHRSEVIESALLPIGQLSEEAAEARNKHYRLYRLNFARKFSRISCNVDVLNRLLLSSDPVITGMRPISKKKSQPFLKETISMLLPAEPVKTGDEDSSGEESPAEVSSGEGEMFSDEDP